MRRPLQALLIESDEEAWNSVIDETKQITIRNGHRDFQKGPCVLCDPEMSIVVQVDITKIKHCTYGTIKPREYKADGYSNRQEMLDDMRRSYPGVDYSEPATVIEWDNARGSFVSRHIQNKKIEEVFKEIGEKSKGTLMEMDIQTEE